MSTLHTPLADAVLAKLPLMPGLVRGCHSRMGQPLRPADLDEAVQEASLIAWRRRFEFKGTGEVESWMYGIARITILRALAAGRQRGQREQPWTVETPGPVDESRSPGSHADTGLGRMVKESLRAAGTNVETILRQHDLDGRTFAAIGEDLGVSEAKVKSRYYRCLPGLRRALSGLWRDASGT